MSNNAEKTTPDLYPLAIIGAGGHAVSVANVAISAGYCIHCFIDNNKKEEVLLGYPILASIAELDLTHTLHFAIAVGDNATREKTFNELTQACADFHFPTLVHSSAVISSFATIDTGTIVMPGAVVGPNTKVGRFCLINTQASIDHDCVMHNFSSLAPGAITGGTVRIGIRSAVSIAATIKHGIRIGDDSVLGANSYLNNDLPSNVVAYGSPAKIVRKRQTADPYLK